MNKAYKFLEHTADVKFRAKGKTIEESFVNSAKALFETIYGETKIKPKIKKQIKIKGEDKKNLLYLFLEEFLFLLDSENLLFSEVKEITIKDNTLKALFIGDNSGNYKFSNPVKAITYNDMILKKIKENWIIEVVLDV